ncbi:MAG: helix-turn-helix domain-containing protein [Aquabacterium sp.]|nr:helix-turn-helix domain-containing protein [Aquabacterium sp.]
MPDAIPKYALYGDEAQPAWLDMVHMEWIHERSSLFDFEIAPHLHEGLIQVLYLTSGGGAAVIDGAKWDLYPQTLIVVPAGHVHEFHFTPDVDGPVVTAAQRPLESLIALVAPGLLPTVRRPLVQGVSGAARHVEALMPLFEAIERESRMQTSGQAAAGAALMMTVMVQIERITAGLPVRESCETALRTRRSEQIECFRAAVDAHFRERLPVARYAAELGLSAGQLSRLCRESLGMSCLAVVNMRVVHEAECELVYSTLGIKQIAHKLGFADDAYFGRFFRKCTGVTPTEFRRRARQRLAPPIAGQRT